MNLALRIAVCLRGQQHYSFGCAPSSLYLRRANAADTQRPKGFGRRPVDLRFRGRSSPARRRYRRRSHFRLARVPRGSRTGCRAELDGMKWPWRCRHALADEVVRSLEVHQPHVRPVADDDVAVGSLQGRAGNHARLALRPPTVDGLGDLAQPGQPVGVGQGACRRSSFPRSREDVACRLPGTASPNVSASRLRDRRLAGARNAHDDDDHRPVVSGMLVH